MNIAKTSRQTNQSERGRIMSTPTGKLKAENGQEPYPKRYAIIVGYGKRKVYTDEVGQRWVRLSREWWKFPEEIEL